MSKYLTVKDFDLTQIGTKFDVQEIRDFVDKDSGEILGHYYDCKIMDGCYKKKWVTIRVDNYSREITNDYIVANELVLVNFKDLEVSSIQPRRQEGLRVFFKADKIEFLKFI
ncbi:TPA: hypothetical protein U5Y67_000087 [Streptococcus agalactiae]|nr:hypothetical protein [Streptococcus agalactiae]HEN4303144.1 hypothetical protein [Streptococcus agalactiae]